MTATRTASTTNWDRLFSRPRHRLRHPDENVVRFLAPLSPDDGDALDAGCGSGRHTRLLSALGWRTYAVDSSETACRLTRQLAPRAFTVKTCPLDDLPFPDGQFGVIVAADSVYYGLRAETVAKIDELHRVLRPGGRMFLSLRSQRDSRFFHRKGSRLTMPAAERGMVCDFLDEAEIQAVADLFTNHDLKLSETFRYADNWRDSAWLLTVS